MWEGESSQPQMAHPQNSHSLFIYCTPNWKTHTPKKKKKKRRERNSGASKTIHFQGQSVREITEVSFTCEKKTFLDKQKITGFTKICQIRIKHFKLKSRDALILTF